MKRRREFPRSPREEVVSAKGKAKTDRIDAARERMGRVIFKNRDKGEVDDFVRLMRKFADALEEGPSAGS